MAPLTVLDLSEWHGTEADRREFLKQLQHACSDCGFFYLKNHGVSPLLIRGMLDQTSRFFDLPEAAKEKMHIRNSSHFRGYSQMKNERDWREQAHFSLELPEPDEDLPECYRLTGPNLWPELPDTIFQSTLLDFLNEAERLGKTLLEALAASLSLPETSFENPGEEPAYSLLKLICYYAQPDALNDRPGVAPHCDWSWLTILLQDAVGGLEVLRADGSWYSATPEPGLLSVNIGELMEIATGGRYIAAAHQVINPSEQKRRISVPVFINPALNTRVRRLIQPEIERPEPAIHIHRVVQEGYYPSDLHFGNSEWKRKGKGIWCHRNACLKG